MRTITFFIYLLFLILGVKQNSYANIQESLTDKFSVQNLTTDFQSKYTIKDQISTLIEDTDLDSDEDQIKNDSKKTDPMISL